MAGSRIPGPIGDVPKLGDDLQSPGAGFDDRGAIGLDTSGTGSASTSVTGWPRNIGWDEFTEVASNPEGGAEDAYISARFDYPWRSDQVGRQYRVSQVTVQLQVESKSWVVLGAKSDPLLEHEQGHYDLTGLMGRDLAEDLGEVRAGSQRALGTEVERIASHYRRQSELLNARYDTETVHGSNRSEQDRWNKVIREAISNRNRLAPRP